MKVNKGLLFKLIMGMIVATLVCSGCGGEKEDVASVDSTERVGIRESEKISEDKSGVESGIKDGTDLKADFNDGSEISGEESDEKKSNKNENVQTDIEKNPAESSYDQIFKKNFKEFNGDVSYSFKDYKSGLTASANVRVTKKSASIIKLFIMEYAYDMIENGEVSEDTIISGQRLSTLIEKMITVSDNEATNALIDYFSIKKINGFVSDCGYSSTVLGRRMLDTQASKRGEENYTSAADVMKFLDKLYANKDKAPYSKMISIMKRQQISTKLRRNMPSGVEIASKTGELDSVENDVAIVFSENGDYAIVCLTEGGATAVACDAMAKTCREIYDFMKK